MDISAVNNKVCVFDAKLGKCLVKLTSVPVLKSCRN